MRSKKNRFGNGGRVGWIQSICPGAHVSPELKWCDEHEGSFLKLPGLFWIYYGGRFQTCQGQTFHHVKGTVALLFCHYQEHVHHVLDKLQSLDLFFFVQLLSFCCAPAFSLPLPYLMYSFLFFYYHVEGFPACSQTLLLSLSCGLVALGIQVLTPLLPLFLIPAWDTCVRTVTCLVLLLPLHYIAQFSSTLRKKQRWAKVCVWNMDEFQIKHLKPQAKFSIFIGGLWYCV